MRLLHARPVIFPLSREGARAYMAAYSVPQGAGTSLETTSMTFTSERQSRPGRDLPEHPCDGPFPTDCSR